MIDNRYGSDLPLKTINAEVKADGETGKATAPERRIGNAADGQNVVGMLLVANRERSRTNAKIKGQIDGNPPYSPAKLKQAGQNYRANINFGEAKAATSAALVPYYDLFAGSRHYFDVKTDFGSADDKEYFSGCITEEFDRMLKRWSGFDYNIQQMLHDFVVYGKGFEMWANKTGWQFGVVPQHKVLVPDGTEANLESLELLVVRERWKVDKAWGFIRNRKTAEDRGWKIQPMVDAIMSAAPERSAGNEQYDYQFVQQKLKDKDIVEGTRSSTIAIAHIYVKEFDGKVSHLIVQESDDDAKAQETKTNNDVDFLFEDIGCYDNFSQAVAPFFLEILDGSWHGASGLGKDIFGPMALKDRLKCSLLDLVFLRTGISLQAKTANALQKTSLVQAGVFNIIPDGYDVQQSNIMGDTKSPMDADVYLDRVVANNTGVYRQREVKLDGNPITAEQARIDQTNSNTLQNSAVNRFYSSLDKLGAETFRRASTGANSGDDEESKMAKEFKKRCIERGVPAEALTKIDSVTAYRNVGNGSLFMRQQALNQLAPVVPMMPESGKQNYLEDVVASTTGHSMVERYAPRQEKAKLPNDHQAQAMLENAALKIGAPVTWTPTQNNVIHAQTHLQAAAQAAASLQQGAQSADVLAFMDAVGHHTAVHLKQLENDPSRQAEYKALTEQFNQLAKITDQLKKKVQSDAEAKAKAQAEAAAKTQNVMDENERENFKVENDVKRKNVKAANDMRLKQEKHDQQLAISDASTANQINTNNAKTASEIASNRRKELQEV